jgi:hypothetical protein
MQKGQWMPSSDISIPRQAIYLVSCQQTSNKQAMSQIARQFLRRIMRE